MGVPDQPAIARAAPVVPHPPKSLEDLELTEVVVHEIEFHFSVAPEGAPDITPQKDNEDKVLPAQAAEYFA